jgi:putative addiction module killer protein
VYYGAEGKTLILLICGGDKGSQIRDIEKARAIWNEYRRR